MKNSHLRSSRASKGPAELFQRPRWFTEHDGDVTSLSKLRETKGVRSMKNRFARRRTAREAMRTVLILASRISQHSGRVVSPRRNSVPLSPAKRSYQQATQRISGRLV
jgi:hypothetical protein